LLSAAATFLILILPADAHLQDKRLIHFQFNPPETNSGLLTSQENLAASIVLKRVPRGMFLDGDTKKQLPIAWEPKINCALRYTTTPGNRVVSNYTSTLTARGSGQLILNPGKEGIGAGTYFCILVSDDDPTVTSVEFTFIVQANKVPIARNPLGTINLQQGTPLFQWDRVGGVPYYFLFLSEGPLAIERDENDKVTGLTGLNLTWQVLTPATFMKYGDPDPSENFVTAHIPPLLPGIKYNWIVLNAYGPGTDLVSGEVAPLAPAFFEVNRPTLSQAPSLIQPAADALIPDDEILFEWNAVPGASRYRLFLYETGEFSGNSIDFTMWSQVTTATQIRLPAKNLLIKTPYHWRVVAEGETSLSTSERRRFQYDGDAGWAKFIVNSEEGVLSRVSINIKDEAEGSRPLPAVTDTFGITKIGLPTGSYTFRASRSGFATTPPAEFTVSENDTEVVNLEIQRGITTLSGRVLDESSAGLADATIEVKSGDQIETVRSDGFGYFTMALTPGNWSLRTYKQNFVTSDFQSISLQAEEALALEPITLRRATNTITGQVSFAADGRPFQGALIRAQQGDIVYETTTNNQGGFTITLGSGRWNLTLNSLGFVASPASYTLDLTENQQIAAAFQLSFGGIVYGTISFQERKLEEAIVQALNKTTRQLVQQTLSNQQGQYSLGLPRGEFELVVSRPKFLELRRNITVTEGQTLVENFTLSEAGFLEGTVINLETTLPVPGARVFVLEDTTLRTFSDVQGNYFLSLPPDVPLQVDAFLSGFGSNGPFTVTATSGQTVRQDFFLRPLSGVIRGQVTDGFAPVAEALVEIVELQIQDFTDANGRFEFIVAPGQYTIKITKACHFPKQEAVNLVAGNVIDLNITLQALDSSVTGKVTDSRGSPLADAQVTAAGDTTFTASTNASGDYELCLKGGIFRITASKLGYLSSSRTFTIPEGGSLTNVNFTLRDNFAILTGTVLDTLDNPVPDAAVTLTNEHQTLTTTTDGNGEYIIQQIIPGFSDIRAAKTGLYGKKITQFLQGQQQANLDLILYPADGFISGTVRDSQNNLGIPGVILSAEFSTISDDFFTTTSDVVGNYIIANLPVVPNSSFTVFAFKEGYFTPQPIENVLPKSSAVDFILISRTGGIAGFVRDRDTQDPIATARVEATGSSGTRKQTLTNAAGEFSLTGLVPTERYRVTVTKAGYFTEIMNEVAPGGGSDVVITLLRRYGFVQGKVTDFATGQPMRNVPVAGFPTGLDGRENTILTDNNGEYLLNLVADFYIVQPVFSHHRSEPKDVRLEITETDTAHGINFTLEKQTVSAISVQRADQSPDPEISNLDSLGFLANAVDAGNRPVTIARVDWTLDISPNAATIDTTGFLRVNPDFFGDVTITATDPVSKVQGSLTMRVFAMLDSTTETLLFNDRGLRLDVPRGSVVSSKKILVSKEALVPAKKARAEFFSGDSSFVIKDATLVFNRSLQLILPPPPNTEGQEKFIAKWDIDKSLWRRMPNSKVNLIGLVEAPIDSAGEYIALAISKALTIENFRLEPNPFSPHQEIDGRSGLKIQFDISSNAAPNPLLTVKIYNLEGNLVRLLHDQTPFPRGLSTIYWDGKADNGAFARNGRYIVRVILEDPTERKEEMKTVVLIK
jgi:protocatechuate 3,4-dioxygenase beta subunit